ncbi:hypothetical protein [Streptococcus pseudoporcinus]|uniref:Uncharacterized protein n=1 Tax=Streptococcus pseudoporcinus TaxID=361101 RepID=A0A4U9XKY7_9STRE|nr:hypothetical protein [Streptococcus pseudoporcinus]QBX28174.1 hypothetical protein Javan444_0012 [Streptococcus phage Javan444]VTS13258.1 Uncharacterised protein [Streptococcus pseudoporcinus]VUC66467.1 Uncharacterised protein [Streptococcus pseudoporcinus]VUC97396.1 Uncharacterised protein [Streptococcus pseudoporcinus]VUC97786.1 Uncharacterised protein [Streptococcus pseudoporcinus]
MVVIKKRNNVIPVDFGDFTLEFLANDENILKMQKIGEKLQKDGQKIADTGDVEVFETLQGMVKESWVELFDEEAYDKVYTYSHFSTVDTMAYLLEVIAGVVDEWDKRNNADALKKYLGD